MGSPVMAKASSRHAHRRARGSKRCSAHNYAPDLRTVKVQYFQAPSFGAKLLIFVKNLPGHCLTLPGYAGALRDPEGYCYLSS
jgi:hypothetical protein